MNSKRLRNGLLISLALALGTLDGVVAQSGSITIYDRGRRLHTSPDTPAARELIARCETQLRTADGILKLAVTPELVRKLKEKEVVVEIRYSRPPEFTIAVNKQTIRPLRLLVPLTGEFSREVTTIFHGATQYAPGPYRNTEGPAEIRALAEKLRGQLD